MAYSTGSLYVIACPAANPAIASAAIVLRARLLPPLVSGGDLVRTEMCAYILGVPIFMGYVDFHTAGLSPDLQSMEQIHQIMRPRDVPDRGERWSLEWRVCIIMCAQHQAGQTVGLGGRLRQKLAKSCGWLVIDQTAAIAIIILRQLIASHAPSDSETVLCICGMCT